jgi:DnaK suppressor protein
MKSMNQKTLAELKNLLEAEKASLFEELSHIGTQNPQTGDWQAIPVETDGEGESDYSDQADYIEEFGSRVARLAEMEKQYGEVLAALDRMEKDIYGICEKSGKPIEIDRLLANPTARTCKAMM